MTRIATGQSIDFGEIFEILDNAQYQIVEKIQLHGQYTYANTLKRKRLYKYRPNEKLDGELIFKVFMHEDAGNSLSAFVMIVSGNKHDMRVERLSKLDVATGMEIEKLNHVEIKSLDESKSFVISPRKVSLKGVPDPFASKKRRR